MRKIREILPDLSEIDFDKYEISNNCHLIIVAGFEERSIGFLKKISNDKNYNKINSVSIIEYKPYLSKNEKYLDTISECLKKLGVDKREIKTYEFDRSYPVDFDIELNKISQSIQSSSHVYCDISAMSKLLILYLLKAIWSKQKTFSVIYSEAISYSPSKKEFNDIKEAEKFNLNEFFPLAVFDPFIPSSFSGATPLGVDRILVGFLSYNKRQLLGATNIIPYQLFIPIIGISPYDDWRWRSEALIEINNEGLLASDKYISELPKADLTKGNKIDNIADIDTSKEYSLLASTLYYKQSFEALYWIARKHRYKHFLTIAPFGSKLQTIGTFLFCVLNPETQIVYSSPKDYYENYSKGFKRSFEIEFQEISDFEHSIKKELDPNFKFLDI